MIALEGVSGESLVNLFRTLSQRRRHGVVAVSHADSRYEVLFHDGKIVGASAGNQPIVHQVLERLKRAGYFSEVELPDELEHSPGIEPGQIDTVRQALNHIRQHYPALPVDYFIKAKQAGEIDLLHLLSSVEEASARFNPQSVQVDPALSISISPGQLLLDLVDLADERRRLMLAADGTDPEQLIVRRAAELPAGLSQAETAVWESLKSEMTLGDLFCRMLVSRHSICERLFSLIDRGGLVLERAEDRPEKQLKSAVNGHRGSKSETPANGSRGHDSADTQRASIDLFQAIDGGSEPETDEIGELSLIGELNSPKAAEVPEETDSLILAGEEQSSDYSSLREVISAIDRSSEVLRNVAGGVFQPDSLAEEFTAMEDTADQASDGPGGAEEWSTDSRQQSKEKYTSDFIDDLMSELSDDEDETGSGAELNSAGAGAGIEEIEDENPDFEHALFSGRRNRSAEFDEDGLPVFNYESTAAVDPGQAEDSLAAESRRTFRFDRISQINLRDLNFFLLDPENAQLISLCVALMFLGSILIFGYSLLDSWFESLGNFTLNLR